MLNPTTLIDGYKLDHRRQYPPKTEIVYSNFTPRGSRIPDQKDVVFIGLQYFLQRYLMDELEGFFREVSTAPLRWAQRYAKRVNGYLGPDSGKQIGVDHIVAWQELGYVPLEFRAIPEGMSVPLKVPMLTVENTHPDFAWLTNYYETLMSSVLWGPCTSATSAQRLRRLLDTFAVHTGSAPEFTPWQGHDFSFRGMMGPEAAALSGMGHLLYFTGTDTIPAIDLIEQYYGAPDNHIIGGSVAATEHSVMCAGGEKGEFHTIDRLLDLYPNGILSVVSDTWDLWHVLTKVLPELKARILARPGKYVTRPDSGDPVTIICGDPDALPGTPQRKGVVELLWDVFGGSTTTTGHRILDPHVGCIYGDSISYDRAQNILSGLAAKGFSSGNVVFGVGSYTYQYVTRDTHNFAMKATWVKIDGVGADMWKAPVTDSGMKMSARGRLAVLRNPETGIIERVDSANSTQEAQSLLRPVWRDGKFLVKEQFDLVRARAMRSLNIR